MKAAGLDKRLQELEQPKIYRIANLADLVILAAWRQRGDPRLPAEDDIEWDPAFKDIYDVLVTKRDDKSEVDLAIGRETRWK
jgi:hypothetical protein